MPLFKRLCVAALIAAAALSAPAHAAGSEDAYSEPAQTPAASGTYGDAKALVKAQNYTEARAMLQDITKAEPTNADAFNLLGFSSRKLGDLKAASKAYSKALKINPAHLGALEYQGEMFIQMGEADKAKSNLATLQSLCGNCEELQDLQKALAAAGIS